MESSRYDADEAIAMMADVAEELAPDVYGHEKAGLALLERLEGLDGEAGFVTKRESGAIWLILRGRDGNVVGAAKIVREDGKRFTVTSRKGRTVEVKLRYNRLNVQLEGEDFDAFAVPVPGQPRRRRSALAVVVEQALSMIREESR
jgi:hypothetical protein